MLFNIVLINAIFLSCTKSEPVEPTLNTEIELGCVTGSLLTDRIAFYPFNNGSLSDYSVNGLNLLNSSSAHATADRFGNADCAFEFLNNSTTTEFLECTVTTAYNNLNEFSISLWYEPIDITRNGNDFEVLISRGEGQSCPDRFGDWSVALYDCRKAVFGREGSVWDIDLIAQTCQDQIVLRTGSWHHLVAIYNSGSMSIYRDGLLQSTSTGPAGCNPAIVMQDLGNLFLGKSYTGKLDDIIIYSRSLTSGEISALYQAPSCCQ